MGKKRIGIEEYERRAKEYFDACDSANGMCDTKQPLVKPYTLSGLLCALSMTREEFSTLYNTRAGRRFASYVLMKIEAFIEENALSGRLSAAFAQGALKYNLGWGEREREETGKISVALSEDAARLGE